MHTCGGIVIHFLKVLRWRGGYGLSGHAQPLLGAVTRILTSLGQEVPVKEDMRTDAEVSRVCSAGPGRDGGRACGEAGAAGEAAAEAAAGSPQACGSQPCREPCFHRVQFIHLSPPAAQ